MTYADGSVYEGMWQNNVRHGVGTLHSPSAGSMFVGTFVQDRRQGLGVTYWAGRGRKHVAEYADDMATCGAMMDLDDESVEAPATQQLRDAIAAARVRAAGAAAVAAAGAGGDDAGVPGLPELRLIQPSKVSTIMMSQHLKQHLPAQASQRTCHQSKAVCLPLQKSSAAKALTPVVEAVCANSCPCSPRCWRRSLVMCATCATTGSPASLACRQQQWQPQSRRPRAH